MKPSKFVEYVYGIKLLNYQKIVVDAFIIKIILNFRKKMKRKLK